MSEILIYGFIGESFWDEDAITAKSVKKALNESNDAEVVVRINSPGGIAFEGVAIYNVLRDSDKRVIVKVDGTAISAASIIAMAGDEIRMADNALMMVHNAAACAFGTADDMRAMAEKLDKISGTLARTYVSRTGNSAEDIAEMLAAETWLDADEALAAGFATHIDGATQDAKAMLSDRRVAAFKRPPQSLNQWMQHATNYHPGKPAGQAPDKGKESKPMSEKLFKALGAADEGEALVVAHEINTLSKSLLKSTGATTLVEAMAAIEAKKVEVVTLTSQLADREKAEEDANRGALIDTLSSGDEAKFAPAARATLLTMTIPQIEALAANSPIIGAAGSAGQEPVTTAVILSDEDKYMMAQFGIETPEDIEAWMTVRREEIAKKAKE